MIEIAGRFTKGKYKINPHFKNISLPILSRFSIDESTELMSSACNLIISSILNKDEDLKTYSKICFEMFQMN